MRGSVRINKNDIKSEEDKVINIIVSCLKFEGVINTSMINPSTYKNNNILGYVRTTGVLEKYHTYL